MTLSTPVRTARIGHSPDPDDAFMFFGIAAGRVATGSFRIEQVLEDIESLNRRALRRELEVSAVSIHAYAHLADAYALMPCGASMGDGYGPLVVAREPLTRERLAGATIAVPGTLTSAFLALRLYLGRSFEHRVVPFDRILDVVAEGGADAGLVIHEGQLTYARQGLHRIADLGVWWGEHTGGLPLPLGGNAVRRDLGLPAMRELTRILRESIEYGLTHREEALAYALDFGRGLDGKLADRFVGMYVNDLTRDYGERGREAIRRFLEAGAAAGVVPPLGEVEFVA
ncbi:MAG TPA: MqnA/MqnD/SBP family protein [Candidatus Polarisedimenticolaceae bacterium]|nr:MqnA/MqnD/SBP family protein [Candidatus Polarisedimenticolaceae bacterium]